MITNRSEILTPNIRSQIHELLLNEPVDAAYLFGSHAAGKTHPNSDIDIGLLADSSLNSDDRFDLRLRLMSSLADVFKVKNVDVVVINDPNVSILLRFNAIKPSVVIYDRDPCARKQFEFKTLHDYFGQYYYNQIFSQTLRRAILAQGVQ